MMEKKTELLAPAGSFESLKAAVHAGADAVYMGGSRFGARAYAENPEGETLLEAIDYAHLHGVKLYLTVNTLLKERELEQELYSYLLPCYERGLDAVIVQDLGVLQAVREWFPDLPIHASTQMTVCGTGGAGLLKREGVKRVVLARELSLSEIKAVCADTGMEIECFVHGALCYCYSGQCLFSSILGGRSGNRGRCAQPCRLAYEALADGKTVSGRREQTLLSPRDICTIDLLPKIVQAGVCSLKIEGRMKRPEYTAGVVRIYRKYLDDYLRYGEKGYHVSEEDKRELLLLFNRDGFSRGYYEQHNGKDMMALAGKKPGEQEKRAYEARIAWLRREYVEAERKIPISGRLYAQDGQPMRLELSACERMTGAGKLPGLTVYGECPQTPKNRPMEASQLEKQLRKTGSAAFEWTGLEIQTEGPLFVPVQSLNQLRRDAFAKMQEELLRPFRRIVKKAYGTTEKYRTDMENHPTVSRTAPELHISTETEEQLHEVLSMADLLKEEKRFPLRTVYVEAETAEEKLPEMIALIKKCGLKAYVALPAVFRQKTAERYKKNREWWGSLPADSYVIRNLEESVFLEEIGWKKEVILDHNVYTFNRRSRGYWREKGVKALTNPLELNSRELREISSEDSIQIIYGRYPMMVTAGCLHKTLDQCRRRPELWILKDRYRKEFPVRNHCRDCYNVIYNSQPVWLLDQMEELKKLSAGAYRIMFTTEDRREVRSVLEGLNRQQKPDKDFTRGHFKRGVE